MKLTLILAAVIPALLLLIQVYRADRLEKEPISMLLGLVLCGIIAAELASLSEQLGVYLLGLYLQPAIPQPGLGASAFGIPALVFSGSEAQLYSILLFFVVVAVSEEGFKYLLLRLRTWRSRHFNCTFDGVVYAVFLSLGFALWENIYYVLQFGLGTALARAVTAVPGHACFGVFMGTWYGAAKRRALIGQFGASRFDRLMAFLMPTLLHGCYDYIAVSETAELGWLFFPFIAILYLSSLFLVKRLSRNDSYMA